MAAAKKQKTKGDGAGEGGGRVIVIMAGGAGERFWPLSNRRTPKQLLRLWEGRSMLDAAFARATGIVAAGNVFVVASQALRPAILKALPQLYPDRYIAEPEARNTAACLGLAAARISRMCGPGTVIGVLTADHVIDEGAGFRGTLRTAMDHAAATGDLVTIGIRPDSPHTGYGYIQTGESAGESGNAPGRVRRVKRFLEKPDLKTAKLFLRKGGYLWNSGMFFWRADSLLGEFDRLLPEAGGVFRRIERAPARGARGLTARLFSTLPSLPIDTAILEKSDRVAVVPGAFAWDDVGSWDALPRLRPTDAEGNCVIGPGTVIDSRNNIVYNDEAGGRGGAPEIVLHGVDDLVVVRTGKALLLTPRSRLQEVKKVVARLKKDGRDDLL